MPAPQPIERSQPITKAQLDALAIYANEKTFLTGKPFLFSETPKATVSERWSIELRRLRSQLWDVKLDGNGNQIPDPVGPINEAAHLDKNSVVTSGPWLLGVTGTYQPSLSRTNRAVTSKKFESDNYFAYTNYLRIPNEMDAKNVEYIFSSASVAGKVTTTIDPRIATQDTVHLGWGRTMPVNGVPRTFGNPDPGDPSLREWKLKINAPANTRCVGSFLVPIQPSSTEPVLSVLGELQGHATLTRISSPTLSNGFRVDFDFIYPGALINYPFEFGFKLENYNGSSVRFESVSGFSIANGTFVFKFDTYPTLVSAIGENTTCKIAIPNSSLEHYDGGDVSQPGNLHTFNLNTGGRFEEYNSRGRVGTIKYEASPEIASSGVWIGLTIPMGFCRTNPKSGANYILNNSAHLQSVGSQDFKAVTPAVDFVHPSYPVRHESEPEVERGQSLIPRGTMIFKVTVSKQPILTGDIYDYPPLDTDKCTIGYMQGNTFVELAGFEVSENEIEFYPRWVVLEAGKMLVYQTASGNKMLIQANIVSAFLVTSGNLFGHTVGSDKISTTGNFSFPLMSEHYNETLEMLNQIA